MTDLSPRLSGRRTALKPIEIEHETWLYQLCSGSDLAYRWGRVPGAMGPRAFHDQLWSNVLTQFVVVHIETSTPLGLVSAWRSPSSPTAASIGVILDPGVHRMGWPLEGFLLFVDHVFHAFDIRKLYAEVLDFNLDQYRGAIGKLFEQEGCLKEHAFVAGAYRDVHLLALHRPGWLAYRQQLYDAG